MNLMNSTKYDATRTKVFNRVAWKDEIKINTKTNQFQKYLVLWWNINTATTNTIFMLQIQKKWMKNEMGLIVLDSQR